MHELGYAKCIDRYKYWGGERNEPAMAYCECKFRGVYTQSCVAPSWGQLMNALHSRDQIHRERVSFTDVCQHHVADGDFCLLRECSIDINVCQVQTCGRWNGTLRNAHECTAQPHGCKEGEIYAAPFGGTAKTKCNHHCNTR